MGSELAFLETGPAGGHRMVLGGLTALERRIREVKKAGASRVVVAAAPEPLPDLRIDVEFVPPGTPPPDGARVGRADEIAGVVVVDDATRLAAEKALLRGLGKSFEGPVDALINSRISRRITRQLARTRVTPNQVTIFAIALGLVATALVGRGPYWPAVAGGVLLQLNSILDSCDGELARLRYQYSRLGQWLDNLGDDVVDNLFIIAAGIGWGGMWVWIAIAAASCRWFVSACTYWSVYRRTGTGDIFQFRFWFEGHKESADEVYDLSSPAVWIRSLGRRDAYVFSWMILCLCGVQYGICIWGAVIALINTPIMIAHLAITATGATRGAAGPADT